MMAQVVAISKFINSYDEVHHKFNLKRTDDDRFFTEWFENLPELTESEKTTLDRVKQRYVNHRAKGTLNEATVILLAIAPLLELAGFYDPPFTIRAEDALTIELEAQEEIFKGRIDVLVVQDQLWLLVVEAKNTQLASEVAIPQCLTYMMGAKLNRPIFGLVTNGGEFILLKLSQQQPAEYDISRVFSLLPRQNELYDVFSFLKTIRY
jgi:predicted type IV restriction endonuclease